MHFKRKRLDWVDITKGIAITLVVIGHMLRGFTSAGLYNQYKGILNYIDFTLYSFHVPLFFLASGLLYSYKTHIDSKDELLSFIKKKCKVIIPPYIIFSLAQLVIKIIMSSSVNHKVKVFDLVKIIYMPVEQFWFLYALLLIFIICAILDYKISSNKLKLLIVTILYIVYPHLTTVCAIREACKYLIYFFIGRFFVEKDIKLNALFCIISYLITNLIFYNLHIKNYLLEIIIAFLGICMIISISSFIKFDVITKLGRYTMPIFLMHTILGSGARIILIKLGIENLLIQVIIGLIFGITVPIYLYKLYKYATNIIKNKTYQKQFIS